jgi:hypothetical protein
MVNDYDRQFVEYKTKIERLESMLKQTSETNGMSYEQLSTMPMNNEPTAIYPTGCLLFNTVLFICRISFILIERVRKILDDYEQQLKQQETEYNTKLRAMAKEMNMQINEKEEQYRRQLNEFKGRSTICLLSSIEMIRSRLHM